VHVNFKKVLAESDIDRGMREALDNVATIFVIRYSGFAYGALALQADTEEAAREALATPSGSDRRADDGSTQ